jgi:hypothetical protein
MAEGNRSMARGKEKCGDRGSTENEVFREK